MKKLVMYFVIAAIMSTSLSICAFAKNNSLTDVGCYEETLPIFNDGAKNVDADECVVSKKIKKEKTHFKKRKKGKTTLKNDRWSIFKKTFKSHGINIFD